ncbi:MAG: hypothetical protein ABI999_09595 [Acidobacteriota bacterium]
MKRYTSEKEILDVLRSFENATIAREAWGHPEHLTVALCYISHHDFETAAAKMRTGIFNLLDAFTIDLTKEMPYHETLTIFWMRTVSDFNASKGDTSLVNKVNELVASYDKNYPLRFYSREYLFSDKARAKFVEGDLNTANSQI